MITIYLALGSNVGDSAQYIKDAVLALQPSLKNIREAPIYVSKAVGYTDQPDFLNTAITGQTNLTPRELLETTHAIEKRLGRINRFRWGPREIDIDIIFYGQELYEANDLIIPHPSFRERDFVLRPLLDLNSDMIDPVSQLTIKQLFNRLDPSTSSILYKM